MQSLSLSVNHLSQDAEQSADLFVRPSPVLRGKSVQCKVLHLMTMEAFDSTANIISASLMAGESGQTTLFCPSAVAIHNYGNMSGERRNLSHGYRC
jgi:hypothetical protein